MLENYKKCSFCESTKLTKQFKQYFLDNFYLKAIRLDLGISIKEIKKIKVFQCNKCKILQNNPWFTEDVARRIYSNIYGQHNRNWLNLINFIKLGKTPNHGELFHLLRKNLKIKNYAEFNSPFMGMLLNFFQEEYKKDISFYKNLKKNIICYLTSRQTVGKTRDIQIKSLQKAKNFLKVIESLKEKKIKKKAINKYLYVDNSSLNWGQNDNYKSVNSNSFASEMFDVKIFDINNKDQETKIDVFGIFHSLDHTFNPKKILNFALKKSKYVIIYCHVDKRLNKQHLFSITREFLKYLNKNNIYTFDLTEIIKKNFISPELYFICSLKKKYISNLEKNILIKKTKHNK